MRSARGKTSPSYAGLTPASPTSTAAARGASKKKNTKCELVLRKRLWAAGLRYRVDVCDLPGRPDMVFAGPRVAVFCDGDFWHGRDLQVRLSKLGAGHNSAYWIAKIKRNVERDLRNTAALEADGWLVIRLWETDIMKHPEQATERILEAVEGRRGGSQSSLATSGRL